MPLVAVHKALRAKSRPGWQDTRPPDEELRDAYAIAANNERAFAAAFETFVGELLGPGTRRAILAAVRADRVEEAIGALPLLDASGEMRERLERAYAKVVQEAGQHEANQHRWKFRFEVEKRIEARFGGPVPINPFSLKWISDRSSWLIREITEQTRENVRSIIFRAFQQGLRGPAILRQIESEVGLLERESRAVERRYQTAIAQGVPEEKAQRDRERHAKRLLRKRAERIARTETIGAQAQGRRDSWNLAQEQGLVPDGTQRQWVAATLSDRTCPICRDLDEQTVGFDEPYQSKVLGTAIDRPPAHPQCRCTEVLEFPE